MQVSEGDIEIAYNDTSYFSDSLIAESNTWGNIHIGSSGKNYFMSSSNISVGQILKGKVSFKNIQVDCIVDWNLRDSSKIELREGTSFEETVSISVPNLKLDGVTFHKSAYIRKTGYEDNICRGNNQFLDQLILINEGTGDLTMANQVGDLFNDKVFIYRLGSGKINMANSGLNVFQNDIEINSNALTKFGQQGGITKLNGLDLIISSNQKTYFAKLDLESTNTITIDAETIFEDSLKLRNTILDCQNNWIHFRSNKITYQNAELVNYRRIVLKGSFTSFSIPIENRKKLSFQSSSGFTNQLEYFTNSFETNRFPNIYNVDTNPFDQFEKDSLIKPLVWSIYHEESSSIEFSLELNTSDSKYLTSPSFMKYDLNSSSWLSHSKNQSFNTLNSSFSVELSQGKNHLIINNDAQLLPIDLLSFSGKHKTLGIEVEWITGSYYNSSHFMLQKLVNGEWREIAIVHTFENNSGLEQFRFLDRELLAKNYYRLQHFDEDGYLSAEHFTYIGIRFSDDPDKKYDILGRELSRSYNYSFD